MGVTSLISKIVPRKFYPGLKDTYLKYRYFLLFPFYSGKKFECTFCSRRFRKLMPCGLNLPVIKEKAITSAGYRRAVCPRCSSTDRERFLYLFLQNKTDVFKKKSKILHFAPEFNLHKILKRQNIEYITADLDSPSAMIKMDITNIPYENNSFDGIICCHVLEHVSDDRKALSELYRVLTPGGWAILQVPISTLLEKTYEDPNITSPKEREKMFGQHDHVRIYGQDYKNRLEDARFSVEVHNCADEFADFVKKYGLLAEENIYMCFKKKSNAGSVQ